MIELSERFRQSWLDNPPDLGIVRDTILKEESGLNYFTLEFVYIELFSVYTGETGREIFTAYGIGTEFLRLHYIYPDEEREQLVKRFRQSIRDGLVITENPWSAQ